MLLWAHAHVNSIFVVVGRSPFELHACCCASTSMFFWACTHPMTIFVAMGRRENIQVPYLFLKMQRPCKFCIFCCGPIAIQTLYVFVGMEIYSNCIRILRLLLEIPCRCGLMPR